MWMDAMVRAALVSSASLSSSSLPAKELGDDDQHCGYEHETFVLRTGFMSV